MEPLHFAKTIFSVVEGHQDIIMAEFIQGVKLDLNTAIEIVNDRISFTNNKMHYLVANVSNVLSITSEAKKYLQQPEGGLKNILGAALIAPNPLSALIANIFIKTPSSFQSRFFSNAEDALNWIFDQKRKAIT